MSDREFSTDRKLVAEFLGSALLVYVLVSSALLVTVVLGQNQVLTEPVLFVGIATAGWLFVIVEVFGPVSGAHVNPAVTVATYITNDIDKHDAVRYVPTQFVGGLAGVVLANLSFFSFVGLDPFAISSVARPPSTYLAEFLGTWLLASVVITGIRRDSDFLGLAVGFVVGMGILATASTAFLNPQVALARIFTTAVTGIRPIDALGFIVSSSLGGVAAGLFWNYMWPKRAPLGG